MRKIDLDAQLGVSYKENASKSSMRAYAVQATTLAEISDVVSYKLCCLKSMVNHLLCRLKYQNNTKCSINNLCNTMDPLIKKT